MHSECIVPNDPQGIDLVSAGGTGARISLFSVGQAFEKKRRGEGLEGRRRVKERRKEEERKTRRDEEKKRRRQEEKNPRI